MIGKDNHTKGAGAGACCSIGIVWKVLLEHENQLTPEEIMFFSSFHVSWHAGSFNIWVSSRHLMHFIHHT